jgi:hypothetical protein
MNFQSEYTLLRFYYHGQTPSKHMYSTYFWWDPEIGDYEGWDEEGDMIAFFETMEMFEYIEGVILL